MLRPGGHHIVHIAAEDEALGLAVSSRRISTATKGTVSTSMGTVSAGVTK